MKVKYHKNFQKKFLKLDLKQKQQIKSRIQRFEHNQADPVLRNHRLKGRYLGYRSINISGDLRAVFKQHSQDLVEFIDLGTHSQLYK